MNVVEEFVVRLAGALEERGLGYFVTWSVASMAYGEARFTQDIDLVVECYPQQAASLCDEFPSPEFYADPEDARRSVERGGQFNIIWIPKGIKADILPFRGTPFDESRLSRARRVRLPSGGSAAFASPEDVILKKLEYYREGGSDKHLRDIAGMLRITGDEIDRAYIERWSRDLGVGNEWRLIVDRLRTPPSSSDPSG